MRIFLTTLSAIVFLSSSLLAQDDQSPQKLPGLFQLDQPKSNLDLNLNLGADRQVRRDRFRPCFFFEPRSARKSQSGRYRDFETVREGSQ